MKNVLYILLLIYTSSCCTNKDIITYNFTEEEKAIIGYNLGDNIKWQNNDGVVFNGTVLYKNNEVSEISEYDCKRFEGEDTEIKFNIDNDSYYVTLQKWDNSRLDLSISKNIGEENPITFYNSIEDLNSFGVITFNGDIFNNVLKLEAYREGDIYLGTLIYSKTNGIEFILFEDGSWYKRLEE